MILIGKKCTGINSNQGDYHQIPNFILPEISWIELDGNKKYDLNIDLVNIDTCISYHYSHKGLLCCWPEQAIEQTVEGMVTGDTMALMWHQFNDSTGLMYEC